MNNALFILIIFQLLFISLFLFVNKGGKSLASKLPGYFFLSIALNLLDVYLLASGVYFSWPAIAGWGVCLPLLFGPLLYFYTRAVVSKNFRISRNQLFHFLPFVVFFISTESFYLSQSHQHKEHILLNISRHHLPFSVSLTSTLIFIQFLFYAFSSIRCIAAYKKSTSQYFSDPKQTNVSWLYSTIVFFIIIMVIATLNGWLSQTGFAKYYLIAFNIMILAVLVFVVRVLLKALGQSSFFLFAEKTEIQGNDLSDEAKNEKEKIAKNALDYMDSHKPYLEPELTLIQLAEQLSVKPRALSQAINDILNQNFFDFINRYRIDEARRLLTNPVDKKITILEVLYKVGFNSKSSFNALFKKYTGLTPTEFRKKQAA